ncbi:collagen alpha-1(I) chain-like [Empidonax traillii]|uniref:collagen alpha-1(I) chain-like n=1 Tax=Empidonax traillii TaxID=164674 RepID=UPI000FFD4149|nr:collagen alpha-1(I) chain-like [Empidonax traillii]
MRSGHPPREALGGPGTDTWGTQMRPNSAPARGQQRRGALGNPSPWLSPGHRPSSRSADLSDVPNGPGRSPGERQESPPPCPPGARSGVPPLPTQTGNPIPAEAPSASRRRAVLGTPVLVRATAEVRGSRQAGAGAVARRPGPHSPCPRRGPSPGPPLPRIASAPRRPPPPAAAAPGRGAGGGRRCPAGTDSRRYSRCRSRCVLGYGSRSRCASRCGAGGGGPTHSEGQRRLHPAAVSATGVKFQPPSPDRRGGHRHRYRDPDSNWHQNTSRHPDTHSSSTGPPTRTGAGTAREQDGTGIPPAAGAAARPASAPAPAGTRTAAELPRKLAPRRERHRDPRRHPTPATSTRTPADPRAGGRAGGPAARPAGRPVSGAPCPDNPVTAQAGRAHEQPRGSVQPFPERSGSRAPRRRRAAPFTWGPGGDGLAGRVAAIPALVGPSGVPRTPSRRGPPVCLALASGRAGGGVRPPRPPAHCAPVLPGGAARRRAAYLCRRSASLRRGRRWPRGHGGRLASRVEPVRVLTSRPGALRVHPGALECSFANVPNPGAASAQPRFTRAPLAGAGRRDAPRAGRAPPGPALMATGSEGARADCVARGCRGPCHLPRPRSGAAPRPYATPRLERGQRLGRRLCRGCTPGPRWPVGSAPSPGTPRGFNLLPAARQPAPRGPAAGADGRACRHLRSRRLVCAHLLGLSSAGVTTPASSCGITCWGVCGRPLSRPRHREQGRRSSPKVKTGHGRFPGLAQPDSSGGPAP